NTSRFPGEDRTSGRSHHGSDVGGWTGIAAKRNWSAKMRHDLNRSTILKASPCSARASRFGSILGVAAFMVFLPAASGQGGQRRQPSDGERRAPSPTANEPFDTHDLSGIWRYSGALSSNTAPPMTPAGKAKYDAAIPGLGGEPGRDKPLGND